MRHSSLTVLSSVLTVSASFVAASNASASVIFFDDAAVATMHTQEITEAIDRQVDIINKMKAKAGA
jgi:hypothetical protein